MKTLVIGGTGLIGAHAVKELIARGHTARVLCRTPQQGEDNGIEYMQGDCLQEIPRAAFEGIEGVVFAAGTDYRILPKESAWDFFHRTNVLASARVFRDARQAGVKRGVFVSSFYHVIRPDYAAHPYIASRRDSEPAVLEACGDDLNISIVEPSWVLGISSGHVSLGEILAKWAYSKIPMIINSGGTNWVAATSLGHAIVTTLERGEHRGKYCVGDENRSWVSVAQQFVDALGVKRVVYVAPRFSTLLTGAVTTLALSLSGRESGLYPYRWMKALMENAYFDPTPAVHELGYPIHCIDSAIATMADYWRRSNM